MSLYLGLGRFYGKVLWEGLMGRLREGSMGRFDGKV
jgi:hypothetical protein